MLALATLFATTGCFARYINVENQDGRAVSIGPVFEAEPGIFSITVGVSDYEGDPVDAILEWRADESSPWMELERCPSEAPCLRSSLLGLSTKERGDAAQHTVFIESPIAFSDVQLRLSVSDDLENPVVLIP